MSMKRTRVHKAKFHGLSMQAVRRGHLYCAAFCGRGCTWAEHQDAQKKGKALAKRLGKGWTVRLWENLGWHYEVISPCGRIKVSNGYGGSYTAFLGGTQFARWKVGRAWQDTRTCHIQYGSSG
jgi:hypothetical protein